MKRRLYSAFLSFAIALSLMPFSAIPAYAAADHTYYSQRGWVKGEDDSLCYATCIAMSLSDLLGKSVTPYDIYVNNGYKALCQDNSKTAKDYGVSWGRLVAQGVPQSLPAAEKEAIIKQLLETGNYPQGIMLHGGGHMVLARKVVNGTVYFDDPAIGCCIPIEKCDKIRYSNITLIACFSTKGANGSNNSNSNSGSSSSSSNNGNSTALSVRSIENGNWLVYIPANYKLLLYAGNTSTSSTAYVSAKSSSYPIKCSKKATLSNGAVRYYAIFNTNDPYWFAYTSGMSVQPDNAATKPYTINFNANGGSVPTSSKTVTNGSTYGTLPTPTRNGYTFDGWYTAASGGTKITSSTAVNLTGNQTLYAHWTSPQTYTVTFDPNGGNVFLPSMSVTNGTIYNSLPNPTRDGYTFTGWYTEKSGGSQIVPTTTVNLKGNQTLYAHWAQNPEKMCTVTFDAAGGTVSPKTVQVAKGSTLNSLPTPTRSGYTFVLWSNTNVFSGLKIEAGKYIVEQDVTLYACWNPMTYVVTFNANGGSVSTSSKTATNGSTYGTLPNPTRSGYTFDGWYTAASGGTQITSSTAVNLTGNQTLYAHWTKNPEKMCTVTFDATGGTVSPKTVQVAKGSTLNSLPTPTRSGYTFVLWSNTNAASGSKIEAGKYVVEQDVTLYAWWQENKTQNTGHWGPWSSWTTQSYTASATRQVETKSVQTVVAHMEYRYGRYVDQTSTNNCWCAKYLEGLSYVSGKAKLEYSNWSTTRYNRSGSTWTCGQCNGNHIGVDHVDSNGRSIWAEYRLPGNKPYYWEESKIVGAQYETQYRYRDWIVD